MKIGFFCGSSANCPALDPPSLDYLASLLEHRQFGEMAVIGACKSSVDSITQSLAERGIGSGALTFLTGAEPQADVSDGSPVLDELSALILAANAALDIECWIFPLEMIFEAWRIQAAKVVLASANSLLVPQFDGQDWQKIARLNGLVGEASSFQGALAATPQIAEDLLAGVLGLEPTKIAIVPEAVRSFGRGTRRPGRGEAERKAAAKTLRHAFEKRGVAIQPGLTRYVVGLVHGATDCAETIARALQLLTPSPQLILIPARAGEHDRFAASADIFRESYPAAVPCDFDDGDRLDLLRFASVVIDCSLQESCDARNIVMANTAGTPIMLPDTEQRREMVDDMALRKRMLFDPFSADASAQIFRHAFADPEDLAAQQTAIAQRLATAKSPERAAQHCLKGALTAARRHRGYVVATDPPTPVLFSGQTMFSTFGHYGLSLEDNGELLLHRGLRRTDRTVTWRSARLGDPGDYVLTLDRHGHLVVQSGSLWNLGEPLWRTETEPQAESVLVLSDDGNLILFAGNSPFDLTRPYWSSAAAG